MEYRRLGTTGMKISTISIGAWLTYGEDHVDFSDAELCIREAIEGGINFIDVADMYAKGKAEETVGKIIADYDRSKLVISTKAFWPMSEDVNDRGLSRKHLMESVEKSLKRLGVDYVDMFFCHRYDPETPTEETVRALDDLIHQGKVLYWGTSMWTGEQIREATDIASRYNLYRPVVEQPVYNMIERSVVEGTLETTVSELGIGLVVFSPLAQGILTGKYNKGVPRKSRATQYKWLKNSLSDKNLAIARGMSDLAKQMGVKPSALALAWVMNHPNVDSVITGATKPAQVKENLKALKVEITPEIAEQIEGILQNRPHDSVRAAGGRHEIPAL